MSGWEKVPAALHLDTSIPPAARALYPVLLYLAWETGQSREHAVLTGKQIADAFGASLPTTRDCVARLEESGWITRSRPSRREAIIFTINEAPSRKESCTRVNKDLSLIPLSTDLTDNPSGANEIVARYVDSVRDLGAPAPRRTVGMVARGVKELLDEGIDPKIVEGAVALMVERRLHPATLPTLVLEASAGGGRRSTATRYGRGMTTRQMLDMTQGGNDGSS